MFLPLLAFAFGALVVTAGAMALRPARASAIDRRLEELMSGVEPEEAKPRMQSLVGFVKRIGEKAPKSPKEMGSLRLRLVQAGYRRDEALTVFFGIRIVFALALFALFSSSVLTKPNIMFALGGLALGSLLPGMVLARMAKRRAHRIRLSLADMLDLLVVSVEAGLGLDQAVSRVGQELAFAYPELSDELRLINLELRAGKPRSEARA
jgi:tight adherence protein C